MNEFRVFLKQVLSNPREMGAVAPSSQTLGRRMAEAVPDRDGNVVEFGAGTGKITAALLAAGVSVETIRSFEVNPTLASHLRQRFSGLKVYEDRAENLVHHDIDGIKAVVSGLPLLSMGQAAQAAIVGAAFAKLQPGGLYIQFTYGPYPPVCKQIRQELSIAWTRSERIWGNIPPATSYTFYRKSAA